MQKNFYVKTYLPFAFYPPFPTMIGECRVTPHQFDALAAFYSTRDVKEAAGLLNLTSKGINAHLRNFRIDKETNTNKISEGIVRYLDSCHKNTKEMLKQHYSYLLVEKYFKEFLLGIFNMGVKNKKITCSLSYETKTEILPLKQIENHLTLVGIKIEKKLDAKESVDYVLEVLSAELAPSSIDIIRKQETISSFQLIIKKRQKEKDTTLLYCNSVKQIVYCEKIEGYYKSIYQLLKEFLPFVNFDLLFEKFQKKQQDILSGIEEKNLSFSKPFKKNNYPSLSSVKSVLIIFIVIIFVFFIKNTYIFIKPGAKEIRSELNLPCDHACIERSDIIKNMQEKLDKNKKIETITLVGIVGMGGVGKTILARLFGKQATYSVVWEINAETKESLMNSFKDLAYALAETKTQKDELVFIQQIQNLEERDKQLLSFIRAQLKQHQDWLLIYDNVEAVSDMKDYYPQDSKVWGIGKVIITTRNSNINYLEPSNIIQVDVLSKEEALSLFCKIYYGYDTDKLTPDKKAEILQFLKNIPSFPLDISVAAYYLKTMNISYATYTEKLMQYEKDFIEVQESLLKEAGAYTKTRYKIIALSLEHVINSHKDFQDLLLFISLLNSQNISRDLLNKYKTSTIVDNFIYNLKKYSLIATNSIHSLSVSPLLSIHRSTQAISLLYLIKKLDLEKNKHFIENIGKILKKYIINVMDKEDVLEMKLILRHAETYLSYHRLLTDFMVASIKSELGNIHLYLGNYEEAKQLLKQGVTLYKKNVNEISPWFARALGCLGNVYRELGNYEKARLFLEESLAIYRKNSYENHPWFARTLGWLGSVYRELGNYEKAEPLFEESLAIYKKNSYENHPWFARTLGCLGNVYREWGEYEKAKQLIEESLAIYRKHSYENHPWFAWTLGKLGSIYRELGNYEKAKQTLEQSLIIYRNNSYENHPWFARTLVWLGCIYRDLGHYEKAKQTLEQSLVIYKKNFQENNLWVARALMWLGCIYRDLGHYEKAKVSFQQSFQVYEKTNKDHIECAQVLQNLGKTYFLESQLEIAEDYFRKALNISQKNKYSKNPSSQLVKSALF